MMKRQAKWPASSLVLQRIVAVAGWIAEVAGLLEASRYLMASVTKDEFCWKEID